MTLRERLFGPSRKDVWLRLSEEMGANFVEGRFAKGDKVEVTHGQWTLTLDTYTVSTGHSHAVFTRMRAPFVNPNGFRFSIYRRSFFSDIGKKFGMQDVEIGDRAFDDDFIVKATDDSQVRSLLSNAKIRELIGQQPQIEFSVKDDEGWFGAKFPEGVDELYFAVRGVIKDTERLKLLYELFAETLDELCRIGSAYDGAPNVTLK
jgi:hypothetical protein